MVGNGARGGLPQFDAERAFLVPGLLGVLLMMRWTSTLSGIWADLPLAV
jgi:hypothetical protein